MLADLARSFELIDLELTFDEPAIPDDRGEIANIGKPQEGLPPFVYRDRNDIKFHRASRREHLLLKEDILYLLVALDGNDIEGGFDLCAVDAFFDKKCRPVFCGNRKDAALECSREIQDVDILENYRELDTLRRHSRPKLVDPCVYLVFRCEITGV